MTAERIGTKFLTYDSTERHYHLAAPLFRTNLKGLERYLPELRQAAHELSVQLPVR